jgi:hypothetical protein
MSTQKALVGLGDALNAAGEEELPRLAPIR